jgi:hypothetical protein
VPVIPGRIAARKLPNGFNRQTCNGSRLLVASSTIDVNAPTSARYASRFVVSWDMSAVIKI